MMVIVRGHINKFLEILRGGARNFSIRFFLVSVIPN